MSTPPDGSSGNHDHDLIEATLRQTGPGRSFLEAFERGIRKQARNQELAIVLAAVERLAAERSSPHDEDVASLRAGIADIAGALERASTQAAALDHGGVANGGEPRPPGEALRNQRQAISDTLDAAEHIQEAAWTLRERGADGGICDLLDERATEVYAACARQDRELEEAEIVLRAYEFIAEKVVDLCRGLRIEAFWPGSDRPRSEGFGPGSIAHVAPSVPTGLTRDEIDFVERVDRPDPDAPGSGRTAGSGIGETFAEIDAMTARERLAFFS